MKLRQLIICVILALVLLLDNSDTLVEARRSGGRSSSSRSRSSSSSGRRTTTRVTRTYRAVPSSFSYLNYHPVGMVVGMPFYDYRYSYYYDGTRIYYGQTTSPVTVIIIIVVVFIFICFAAIGNRGHGDGDDEYTEVVTETVTYDDDGAQRPQGQVYAPGTQPPGTALCNAGHIFAFMTTSPYPGDSATCENCNNVIQSGYGQYHCAICEADLCKNCGDGRVKPAQQMPPQQQWGQPGQFPPGQMPPGQFPPGQMPPQYPPGQMQPPQYPPGQMPPGQGFPGQPPQYPPGTMPPQQQWQ